MLMENSDSKKRRLNRTCVLLILLIGHVQNRILLYTVLERCMVAKNYRENYTPQLT